MTWLDAALKLKPDTALVCNGDPRPWTVVRASNNAPREMIGLHSGWHVEYTSGPLAFGNCIELLLVKRALILTATKSVEGRNEDNWNLQ